MKEGIIKMIDVKENTILDKEYFDDLNKIKETIKTNKKKQWL